ncbi:hypothetical protein L6R53_30315 [Myxococcota bacterium]|nr:hypothetical protein [Myxococcota bacterium]
MWPVLLSFPALAGVPVVVDGGDAAAVPARVSERTGLPVDQLALVELSSLLDDPPQALGDAVMRRCAGAPTRMEAVRADLVRAEAAWTRRDRVTAFDHLDLAVAQLGCLGELVDREVAARTFLLRGALLAERGQPEAAQGELRTALAFDPELAWTGAFPVEGEVLLAEQRAQPDELTVRVVPAGTSSGPWIDGRTVGGDGAVVAVGPGLHLAQHPSPAGIRSAWLVVGGDTTLVLPGSFRRPVLEALAEPATREPVQALLQATLPGFQAAYVSHQGWLWLLTLAGDQVETSELVVPPPPVEEEPARGRKKKDKQGD